jgi:phospholipid/cholesterol/gamma-HCH transport system substrate-binding protein
MKATVMQLHEIFEANLKLVSNNINFFLKVKLILPVTLSKKLADGQGSIGKLLSDETLVNNLQLAVVSLRQASTNAQQLTSNISDYASRLRTKGSLTNDLITDTVIFSQMKATVMQLHEISKTANDVTNNLKLVSNNINDASNNLKSTKSPMGVLLNDEEAGRNLKITLANLQSGTKKLDDNLEALQHNFFLKGFFKKKAKKEDKDLPAVDTIILK